MDNQPYVRKPIDEMARWALQDQRAAAGARLLPAEAAADGRIVYERSMTARLAEAKEMGGFVVGGGASFTPAHPDAERLAELVQNLCPDPRRLVTHYAVTGTAPPSMAGKRPAYRAKQWGDDLRSSAMVERLVFYDQNKHKIEITEGGYSVEYCPIRLHDSYELIRAKRERYEAWRGALDILLEITRRVGGWTEYEPSEPRALRHPWSKSDDAFMAFCEMYSHGAAVRLPYPRDEAAFWDWYRQRLIRERCARGRGRPKKRVDKK